MTKIIGILVLFTSLLLSDYNNTRQVFAHPECCSSGQADLGVIYTKTVLEEDIPFRTWGSVSGEKILVDWSAPQYSWISDHCIDEGVWFGLRARNTRREQFPGESNGGSPSWVYYGEIYEEKFQGNCACTDPDIPRPNFPTSNTTERKSWKELKSVSCRDEDQSEPVAYTEHQGEKQTISYREDCCDTKEWWILSCDKNETSFPDLNQTTQEIAFTWTDPTDRTNECTADLNGTVQEQVVDCNSTYRCVVTIDECNEEDIEFPNLAENQQIAFVWSEEDNKTAQCSAVSGEIQESKKSCRSRFRCLTKTDSKPNECPENINSYVTPKDRAFHEDIALDGVGFGLHYSSSELNQTIIAKGWSLSNHHSYKDGRVYLGSGRVLVETNASTEGADRIVREGTQEFIFDASLQHIATRNAYTKKPIYTFGYEDGNLTTITDIFGKVTTLVYDTDGRIESIVAPHGQTTAFSINAEGDLLEVQYEDGSSYAFEYENHLMTKETEPNGNIFLHIFDAEGKITKVIDAEQGEWSFNNTSSAFGTKTVTRASGDTVRYKNYSLENGKLKFETILASGEVVTTLKAVDDSMEQRSACGMTTVYRYKMTNGTLYHDPITQKRVLESITTITPSGLSNVVTYNREYSFKSNGKLKRILSTQNQNGKSYINDKRFNQHKVISTTPEGKKDRVRYDNRMLLIKELNPHGFEKTKYSYDGEGRVTKIKRGDRKTRYSYNSRGGIASITDAQGRTTTYEYDSRDRVKTITYHDGNTLHYSYDANGNMQLLTTPTPTEHSFGYNGVNKRVNYTSPLGKATTYSYDKQRRVTKITKPSGAEISTTYTNGRVTSIQTPEGTTNYTYSCQSNLASTTKGSESLNYSYDGTLLTQITQQGLLNQTLNYSYNNDFLISSFSYAGATQNYSYNQDNNPTQIGDFNISKSTNNRIKTITDGVYTQTINLNKYAELRKQEDNLFKVVLTRNKNGQIKKKVEKLQGSPRVVYRYTYDNRGRLIKVKKGNQVVEKYVYDSNGNRVKTTSKLRGVINEVQTYNSDDQIRLIGAVEQNYNDDGYLIEKKLPNGELYSFEYGTVGELKKVTTPTKTIEYLHNANNQRVAKKVDGVIVEKYLWANLTTLLAVYDANDTLVQRFEYVDNRMPIAMTQNGSKYYLHYDQVGSLRAISRVLSPDNTKEVIKEITYDSYGNILSDSNSSLKVPFGFAGGLYDSDTKLTRFGYRDYDAYTGKWTAKDPILFSGGDSNLYGYVLGDPVDFVDPNGLVDVNSGFGTGIGFMVGFGGANYHEHFNCSSNGCVRQTIVCGRLGLGIHFGGGVEGNAGVNPNGTYGEDCDGDNKECTYDWSVGIGGELQFGYAGAGGSVAGGSSGFGAIMDLVVGVGLGAGAGVEVCVIKSCPLY